MARLLFAINNPAYFLSHRRPLGEAAAARGLEVHVAAPTRTWPTDGVSAAEAVRQIEDAGWKFHRVPVYRAHVHPLRDGETLLRMTRLFRRLRPEVVHLVTYKAIALGGLAARLARLPAVVSAVPGFGHVFTVEGVGGWAYRKLMSAGYRAAFGHPNQVAILQNAEGRELLVDQGLVERRNTALIPGSGVDPERFRPEPEPGGVPLVALVSRMLWTKGVAEFVEAAERLRASGIRARFALVGDTDPGNRAAVPRERLEAWSDGGAVEWWGFRADMPEVFRQAAVVCLPSRYGEGIPKVLLEAAAAGRPMVATDIPGCREIVRHGETGLLVPEGEPEPLAEAIRALVADPERRRAMGRAARSLAVAEFTVDRVAERHLEVYRRVLRRAAERGDERCGAALEEAFGSS